MASLVLGLAGQAAGTSIFGAGFSLLGMSGAEVGGAITVLGALGGFLDGSLPIANALNLAIPAILAMTIRHGMTTAAKKA